jgi:hypothetical protein
VLIIDQVENVFADGHERGFAQLSRFMTTLRAHLDRTHSSNLRIVVLAYREEFHAKVSTIVTGFPNAVRALQPMSSDEVGVAKARGSRSSPAIPARATRWGSPSRPVVTQRGRFSQAGDHTDHATGGQLVARRCATRVARSRGRRWRRQVTDDRPSRGAGKQVRLRSLQVRAAFSTSAPDRMDFDQIALAIMKVVHVAAGLLHEHTLNQLAARQAVALTFRWHKAQLVERLCELFDEELLGVAVLAPPLILCFEPPLCLIKQDDLHDGRDTA